ncbi:calcium/sodium antiporter [Sphingomicrobium astaxanthinifaciens]|uniref:calcium/sodium antiporter n=1 Tax=Sphingomicrobium astaxanthinifaciens TaxID=1227949 RepID=UPI001FCA8CE6|nr:calcium/sodium antiporter [Sphingomicrobium astaxanthinifaciens]MCJ7420501.1 calcium/sodium antiporter [Sphingomicrobium astaxanthinifaciens]
MTYLLLLGGLALLIVGGDLLVRGAVRIAERMGLSPMLIGLTIVGMGTSMPELAASVQAALAGSPGIALGNIVGSNIANSLLILGVAAAVSPFVVPRGVLWRDGGMGALAALALLVAGHVAGLSRPVGLALVLAMIGYVLLAYRQEKAATVHGAVYDKAAAFEGVDPAVGAVPDRSGHPAVAAVQFIAGLGLIIGGGSLLVDAAITIASDLGVGDDVIGLTVVAVGTSLPELVTSAIAAFKRQGEIALGNVLGSNIYNILFIGGVTGMVAPTKIPAGILGFDLPLLLGIALLVMVFAYTGGRLRRSEGAALVAGYAAYTSITAGLV